MWGFRVRSLVTYAEKDLYNDIFVYMYGILTKPYINDKMVTFFFRRKKGKVNFRLLVI